MKQNLELKSTPMLAYIDFAKTNGLIYNLLDNDDLSSGSWNIVRNHKARAVLLTADLLEKNVPFGKDVSGFHEP